MVRKATSMVQVLVSMGVGVFLSLMIMVLQLVLSAQSPIRRVLMGLNWPVDHAISWFAQAFCNGNMDQLISQGMLLWCIYWLMLGSALGLAGYKIWRASEPERLRRRA